MTISYLERPDGPRLAYRKLEATASGSDLPTVIFMGGFRSDMEGTKAVYFEDQCRARGQAYVRFDYSGHGSSEGKFEDGTISQWAQDAFDIFDTQTEGPVIVVGSSMGGWIALLVTLARKDRVCGLIGLAAAPDFTVHVYENEFSDAQRAELEDTGYAKLPNDYGDPYSISKELIEDGKKNCLLHDAIDLHMPVCLIQGMKDTAVEWQTAYRIKNALPNDNKAVEVVLLENSDHRLSNPEELVLIDEKIRQIGVI